MVLFMELSNQSFVINVTTNSLQNASATGFIYTNSTANSTDLPMVASNETTLTTTELPSLDLFEPTTGNIIEIVVLIILCILILLGNALVILAFIKGPRSIRTHTNYFVVNLAVCDFMVGCLSVPSWILVRLGMMIWCFIFISTLNRLDRFACDMYYCESLRGRERRFLNIKGGVCFKKRYALAEWVKRESMAPKKQKKARQRFYTLLSFYRVNKKEKRTAME